mgnify:CR=1 FL=1
MARKTLGAVAIATALCTAPLAAEEASELFEIHCAACHNTGGIGNPGLAPPLNRPAFWQALGEAAPAYLAGVMVSGLNGKLTIEGQVYVGLIMPPVTSATEAELAEIGTWVLQALGETGEELTQADLTQADLTQARATRPSHADLRAMRPVGE